jgi:hypothetical protein
MGTIFNQTVPIFKLPTETILDIFEQSCDDAVTMAEYVTTLASLQLACTAFRDICLASSKIWTRVDNGMSADRIVTHFSRSNVSPMSLDLNITSTVKDCEHNTLIFGLLKQHSAHFETADVRIALDENTPRDYFREIHYLLTGWDMPSLISFSCDVLFRLAEDEPCILGWNMPNLRHLSCHGHQDSIILLVPESVKTLNLYPGDMQMLEVETLWKLLELVSQTLETLTIHFTDTPGLFPYEDAPWHIPLSFPQLRYAGIRLVHPQCNTGLIRLLERADFSNAEMVDLFMHDRLKYFTTSTDVDKRAFDRLMLSNPTCRERRYKCFLHPNFDCTGWFPIDKYTRMTYEHVDNQ